MHVSIQSGQSVAADKQAPAHDLYTTKVFDNELHDADALVDSVIRQNGGGTEVAAAKTVARGRT